MPLAMERAAPLDKGNSGVVSLAMRYRRMLLPLLYLGSAIRHMGCLSRLWDAPEGSLLSKLVASRPEIWQLLRVRFISALWPTPERFARIVDHCNIVERMGPPFSILPNEYAELLDLTEIGDRWRLTLDCPRWLLREGLLALNLLQGRDRFFSIAFVLAWKDDELIAYVGGIQGRRGKDVLDEYRKLTKIAHGTRPQDLLFEAFRILCQEIGVMRILCVSDDIRNGRTPIHSRQPGFVDPVSLDYDALWEARSGVLQDDGFYELGVERPERPWSEVPPNRRARRRKRIAMLESIQTRLAIALADPTRVRIGQHEPHFP